MGVNVMHLISRTVRVEINRMIACGLDFNSETSCNSGITRKKSFDTYLLSLCNMWVMPIDHSVGVFQQQWTDTAGAQVITMKLHQSDLSDRQTRSV